MRFKDMPENPENSMQVSDAQKNWILQATLQFGDNYIRMSDTIREFNDSSTDRIGIVVESDVNITEHAFAVLAEEGTVSMPLQKTFFSPAYGIVYDKYGVMWNLAGIQED